MKRIIISSIVLLATSTLLFAFDIFAEEEATRNVHLQNETSLIMYKDKSQEPQLLLAITADYEDESYKAQTILQFDAKKNLLSAKQLSLSLFWGNQVLTTGWTTHPWGSASLSHIVDVLNAQDLSRGIVDDMEAMKRPELMISLTVYQERSALDLVVKPGFLPTIIEDTGRWSLMPPAFSSVSLQAEETENLEKFGGGARYRIQMSTIYLGLLYFNGYYPQSGYTNITFNPSTFAITGADTIHTRYQLIGLESSSLFGPITLALEGGFFLSEDREGSDPGLYNSKYSYLAELSYTHGTSGTFLAVAYQGQYVLHFPTSPLDVDVLSSYDGKAYANTIIAALESKFFREKLTMRVSGTYQFESTGYLLLASASYALRDNLSCFLKTTWYGSIETKESIYHTWDANDSLHIGLKAWF
ncbi:MAG: hypothetical protein AB7D92_00940 [Sphaerochaeta sp.]